MADPAGAACQAGGAGLVPDTDVPVSFAAFLVRWRAGRGMSLRRAAALAGVTPRTWALWERGSTPRLGVVPGLARLLGLQPGVVLAWIHGDMAGGPPGEGEVARAVRDWRRREALSLERAARRLGVASTTVRDWEMGRRPRGVHLQRLLTEGVLGRARDGVPLTGSAAARTRPPAKVKGN